MDNTLTSKIFLTLLSNPCDLLILLATVVICSLYFKSPLMMIPRILLILLEIYLSINSKVIITNPVLTKINKVCVFRLSDNLFNLNNSGRYRSSLFNVSKQQSVLLLE